MILNKIAILLENKMNKRKRIEPWVWIAVGIWFIALIALAILTNSYYIIVAGFFGVILGYVLDK
jgi:hypothetical protein